jgi:hypothetical protein
LVAVPYWATLTVRAVDPLSVVSGMAFAEPSPASSAKVKQVVAVLRLR